MQNIPPLAAASLKTNSVRVPSLLAEDKSSNALSEDKVLSLADVLTEFEQWRRKKTNPAEPIPDELWDKLFQLAETYSPVKIRSIFNINNKQYQKKLEEKFVAKESNSAQSSTDSPLQASFSTINSPSVPLELCELKMKPSSYQTQPLPNAKTMVVEFHREDGRRMILHVTSA